MPFIDSLDVAARIRRICMKAEIVFVSSELHYAVEAFNLNALDYLLKPLEPPRLAQTIKKLLRRMKSGN
jgi:two-component SAPR family response regulator